jgi:hypothetical protein
MMSIYFSPTSASPNTSPTSKVNGFASLFSHRLIPTPEHNLTGDVLCIMGPEDLKEIGITTVGQRLAILKAIYLMKLAYNLAIEPDHYIPPC